jgi:hypothetical protein
VNGREVFTLDDFRKNFVPSEESQKNALMLLAKSPKDEPKDKKEEKKADRQAAKKEEESNLKFEKV